jgi:hypothetical protein
MSFNFFTLSNLFSRSMALGFTPPLTEMNIRSAADYLATI